MNYSPKFIHNCRCASARTTLACVALLVSLAATAAPGYFRYPDLHGDTIVFTAEGDLWQANIEGGEATRLTSHPAEEKEPAISPDGKLVAYAAKYEGSTEVYLIPVTGGVPKRLTYESSSVRVHGWSADGKVLYSANNRLGPPGNWTLRLVDPESLSVDTLPVADAVEGVIDNAGATVFFVQFGDQVTRDNLKFYRGGATGELWRYRPGTGDEARHLTGGHKGSVREPMLAGDRLYFISDESGNNNIWSMNLKGKDLKQVTRYKDWPVRTAAINQNRIVYQLGADIKLLDLESGKSKVIDLRLSSDFPGLAERWIKKPLRFMNSARFAGDHDKVVITARGKVAIAGIDRSRLVEVATHPTARVKQALLSHDGKHVYGISDSTGEQEIWQFSASGNEEFTQLTTDGTTLRWNLKLSPDGKWLAHDDKHGDLWLLNIESRENKKIAESGMGLSPYELAWSADSQFLAYSRNHRLDERSRISLYSLAEQKQLVLTTDDYNAFSPAFSPDGDWLYFLSDRYFSATVKSPWGDRNLGPSFDRRTLIFAYALNQGANFPFQAPNELSNMGHEADEPGPEHEPEPEPEPEREPEPEHETEHETLHETVHEDLEDSGEAESEDKKIPESEIEVTGLAHVDWQGIENRLWQVPVPSGNYSELKVNRGYLYLLDKVTEPGAKSTIQSIKQEPFPSIKKFKDGVSEYDLSDDGKRMFIRLAGRDNGSQYIVGTGASFPRDVSRSRVLTNDWQIALQPKQEWQLMFKDAWLMHREYLFDPNMRGVDWQKVKLKYEPLLDRITDRHELDDVLRHMSGEVSTFHSQVGGGDYLSSVDSPAAATLGAILTDTESGVRITHIYRSEQELPFYASPLARSGVDAVNGDFIQAVNGEQVASVAEVRKALRNKAGKQVLLKLLRGVDDRSGNVSAESVMTVTTIVVPLTILEDYRARYRDWIWANRQKVLEQNPDLGYLHLRAMGASDIASFARDFYANYNKQGLIIDVRRNRGGNIDSWIIEKLLRRAWSFWQPRDASAYSNMQQTFRGHLVVLVDENTYSDGETFAAGIKALELGAVIGKRTTGAGVWLTDQNRLVDKGIARVAEHPVYAMDGRWVNEGIGVTPDIEVVNYPHATFAGKDAQLAAAIRHLEKKIKQQPVPPMKSRRLPDNLKPADSILEN